MTAKEYLQTIRKYRRVAQSLAGDIEVIRNEIGGLKAVTYDKDRVQVSPSNRTEELIPKLIKTEEMYVAALIKYRTECAKRIQQIAELDNPDHVEILRLRYIESDKDGHPLSWQTIADTMHWSYSKVTHMHGYALQAFARKYLQTYANENSVL